MFRLYVGLVKQNTWYNHAKCKPLKGGTLNLMDSPDNSGLVRLLRLIQGSISHLYTESGEEIEVIPEDLEDLKLVDCWKIALEANKLFSGNTKPMFAENFYCPVCSSHKNERYTKVCECWDDLVEKGMIDEIFLESKEELQYETVLPVPIVIEPSKQMMGGSYNTLIREYLSIKQAIQISKNTWANASEANMVYATFDAQIKAVKGLADRDLTILKRNKEESFSKKYLVDQENIDVMSSGKQPGYNAEFRNVSCVNCQSEIGGHLDFTNFFSFLSTKKSNPLGKVGG